jgi:hypothetical protein
MSHAEFQAIAAAAALAGEVLPAPVVPTVFALLPFAKVGL